MKIYQLQIDKINMGHIERGHGVNRSEVEEICFGIYLSRKQWGRRYKVWGQTKSGRYLIIIVEQIKGTEYRPITAFDMAEKDKRYFKKHAKR